MVFVHWTDALRCCCVDIDKLYQERDREEYAEGIIDIYVALAAKALSNYSRVRQAPHVPPQVVMDFNKKIVENLRIVDEKQRINEYTWLIRGFYEILQGKLRSITRSPCCCPDLTGCAGFCR